MSLERAHKRFASENYKLIIIPRERKQHEENQSEAIIKTNTWLSIIIPSLFSFQDQLRASERKQRFHDSLHAGQILKVKVGAKKPAKVSFSLSPFFGLAERML
jgi:hypothetical protein